MKTLLFFTFLLLTCCQPQRGSFVVLSDGQRVELPYHETLTTVIRSEPPKIDWLLSSDTDSSWIEEQLMDGLVKFDLTQQPLQIKPALATHWQSQQGGRLWVFHLRRGVKWSDGVEFKIQHVLDAFERILNPNNGAIAVDNIFPLKNAKAYNQGRLTDFSKVGVRALDDWTVAFELNQPMAFFPMLLTHHTTFPVRKDVIARHGEMWTEPENIVTLGAYKLLYWHHDSRIVLERNKNYWDKPAPIRFIVFYMINKPSTALRMFERGKIDFIRDLPTTEIPRLRKKPEFHHLPGLRLYYYGFKINKKPFDNKKVRQAIAHAIDRQEITKILGGGQVPLKGWVPPGMYGYDDNVGIDFNVEKAKKLIVESQTGDPKKWPAIVLGFNTEEKHKQIAENVQAQLKKNLGLQVELKNEEWKTFLNGLRSDSAYDIFRLGWVADYADPHNFMAIMTSFAENNRTGWGSEKYDQWVEEGLKEVDPQKRLAIYHQAQKFLLEEEVPVIPLLADVNQLLVSRRIKNYHNNVLDLYDFATMELESK